MFNLKLGTFRSDHESQISLVALVKYQSMGTLWTSIVVNLKCLSINIREIEYLVLHFVATTELIWLKFRTEI